VPAANITEPPFRTWRSTQSKQPACGIDQNCRKCELRRRASLHIRPRVKRLSPCEIVMVRVYFQLSLTPRTLVADCDDISRRPPHPPAPAFSVCRVEREAGRSVELLRTMAQCTSTSDCVGSRLESQIWHTVEDVEHLHLQPTQNTPALTRPALTVCGLVRNNKDKKETF
jgi:hypothetical protein